MSTLKYERPKLPSHYYVLFEPPDSKGDEVLNFVSERRRIVLKGHFFREFQQYVIPLLDGRHTVEEIAQRTSDVFRREDLVSGLKLLADQHLLEGSEEDSHLPNPCALEPQLNFFHEVSEMPLQLQGRLAGATITIFGLAGAGGTVALALAAARVGTLRCVDSLPVAPADPYLSPCYVLSDVGCPRSDVLLRRLASIAPEVRVIAQPLYDSEEEIARALHGSDFVVCCLDAAQSSMIYKLNRVCLREKKCWTSCSTSGLEVIVGPTVRPMETACYMCYRMRAVACAEDPEREFTFQRMLDRRKQDDSSHRENLSFATGIAANVLALEVFKEVSGLMSSVTVGKVLVIDLLELTMTRHLVLRKPWCPACFAKAEEPDVPSPQSAGA
jgi:molybdopterin-synthase adenylyltransferase